MGQYNTSRNHGYETGHRVKVVRQYSYPKLELIDSLGTVKSVYSNSIAVQIDGWWNTRSSKGWFYFKASELKIIDDNIKEENDMSCITNYLNIVKVRFGSDQGPAQHLYANFDPELKVDDVCVVNCPNSIGSMSVATVVEIFDTTDLDIYREVVAKVDMGHYEYRVATRAKAAELKAKMQERAKKLQDIALYQMLADNDAEMMALLQEYQALPEM